MELSDMRTRFKKAAGRQGMSDADANYFINAALTMLNDKVKLGDYFVTITGELAAEAYSITISNCVSVEWVKYRNEYDSYYEVIYLPFDQFIKVYPRLELTSTSYSVEETEWELISPMFDEEFTEECFNWTYSPNNKSSAHIVDIMLLPPQEVAQDYMIKYKSSIATVSSDDDENTWMTSYPDVVIMAAVYLVEVENGNMERMRNMLSALTDRLVEIDADQVEREMSPIQSSLPKVTLK